MVDYIVKSDDFRKMLESMQELYQETERVSPKMLAERITKKIGRNYNYHRVAYLFTQLGFVTVIKGVDRFIVRDDELIKKLISELPQIEARTIANAGIRSPSIYSDNRNFGNWDYLRPY
jgi:hypothetical protein